MQNSYRVPPYRVTLDDQEIADLATLRSQVLGQCGCAVTVEEVRDLRDRTNPFSDRVILLQMR
jgi:hypothetical protein